MRKKWNWPSALTVSEHPCGSYSEVQARTGAIRPPRGNGHGEPGCSSPKVPNPEAVAPLAAPPQTASVQLSENANADVENGRPSRSRGQDRPFASTPLRTRRVPSAGISTVHTP